jgi:hypothetical protein
LALNAFAIDPITRANMNKLLTVLTAVSALLVAEPSQALTLYFSLTGADGTVTGEIDNLAANYNGPTSTIFVDSAPVGYVMPTPAQFFAPTTNNIVTDAAGNIVSYDIIASYQAYIQLDLSSACLSCNFLDQGPPTVTALSFPAFSTFPPTSETPIPGSATLLVTVLGLVALIVRRHHSNGRLKNATAAQHYA